jgi:hypothetical protein
MGNMQFNPEKEYDVFLYKWKKIMKEITVARNQKYSSFRIIDSIIT